MSTARHHIELHEPPIRPGGPVEAPSLPWAALLVMAFMGFLLIATETMPAGLLPQISAGLGIGEGSAGQLVSAYGLGTVVATMPLIALTRGLRRKPVFILGIIGFLITNVITAFSPAFALSLGARFLGGAFSGLLWGMLGGYARRISAPEFADVANALLGVAFNLAIFAAGVIGAVLIGALPALVLPVFMIALASVALVIAFAARRSAFPTRS